MQEIRPSFLFSKAWLPLFIMLIFHSPWHTSILLALRSLYQISIDISLSNSIIEGNTQVALAEHTNLPPIKLDIHLPSKQASGPSSHSRKIKQNPKASPTRRKLSKWQNESEWAAPPPSWENSGKVALCVCVCGVMGEWVVRHCQSLGCCLGILMIFHTHRNTHIHKLNYPKDQMFLYLGVGVGVFAFCFVYLRDVKVS